METPYVFVKHDVWKSHFTSVQNSTTDSWTLPSGRFDTSENDFSSREVAHTLPKLIDGMRPSLETGGLVIRITNGHHSTTSSTGIIGDNTAKHSNVKVELSIFESSGRNSEGLVSECDLTEAEKEASTSRHKHYLARAEWDRIVVPISVESSTRPCAFDPISAGTQSPEAETIGSGTVSGKITQPVGKIFEHQHRNFVFSIYIHGRQVFLVRWDRVGAVVSEPFSLAEEPDKLLDFLFRLGKTSPAQRGYDTSIRPASEAEAEEFSAFIPVDSVPKAYLQDALRPDGDKKAAIFQVDLQDLESSDMTQLVFARPRVLGKGVEGRATRGYIAYDLVNKRLVFLKDYWQPDTKSCHLELDTYKRLQAKNVPYVATPVGGGYVASGLPHGECYQARVHYRFAVQEIGRPLEDYRDAEEMVGAVYFAVTAHRVAWEKAGVLHQDISPGNILIKEDGEGILNDWDMCKYQEEVESLQGPASRTGTWPFMSALLLRCPKKPHQVSDDVESFVHVINWLTVRFQVFSTSDGIDYALKMYEECRRNEQGFDVGGGIKSRNLKNGVLNFDLGMIQPPALQAVIERLLVMCKEHYSSPEVVEMMSSVNPQVKPPVLSSVLGKRQDKILPALPETYQLDEFPGTGTIAPVGGKPLMKTHKRITEILHGILTASVDPVLWQGQKLDDQFLKRPLKSACLTAPGGSASVQESGTSPKHTQSCLKSTQRHNVSSTHSKRSLALSEEYEVQGRLKRVKQSDE